MTGGDLGLPYWEPIDPPRLDSGELEPGKGLLVLPEPAAGDLFLDPEGDPFALDDGVDYLFGILEPGLLDPSGQPRYHRSWARDDDGRVTPDAERRAFRR